MSGASDCPSTTVQAMFDGCVFRPTDPVSLPPNTRVRLTIEPEQAAPDTGASFLEVAEGLKLQGPADWAVRIDEYLYGGRVLDGE